jgi:hypothetical protein
MTTNKNMRIHNSKNGNHMNKKILLAMVLPALLSSCASITQGTSQILIFNIEPKDTRCVLTRVDDGQIGIVTASQNTVTVSKDKDDIVVQCKAEGYKGYTTRIVSTASGAGVTGAIFIDLGITDLITGAMWKYPDQHNISLEKEGTTPAATPVAPNLVIQQEAPSQ